MTERAIKLSIRSLFLWVVMTIAAISLVSTSGLSIYTQINAYRYELDNRANLLAKMTANAVANPLRNASQALVEESLQFLDAADKVLNVHIYKTLPDGSNTLNAVERFASYNKGGQLLIPGKQKQLINLDQTPLLTEDNDYLESSRKIFDQETNEVLGWVYLRMSADGFSQHVIKTVLVNLGIMLFLLGFSFFLALRFQRRATAPIEKLSFFLQRTSRQRDYSARAEPSNIKEIDVLSDDVNIMLSRIQEYMHRQRQAEEQHRKLNASLEEMVSQRTNALKDANQELIQTLEKLHEFQRQIVQNEKMASLGDMVAGVAHEVNTPIGLGVTASTMMLDRLAVIERDFENKTLKASAMKRFMDESHENLNIIYRNLNRAAELISSFKQVAVDQSSESSRTFCFAQLVNEILLSLQPRLKKLQHNINVDCDPTLCVETKAGPINQIIINLIMNSVIHGFENIEKGQIDICAELITTNKLKIVYRDNGIGIPSDIRKRIFDPFVTTKRGQGGSGLGMHLVYNLVTQALNGSISITSEVGSGVEFVIVFPVSSAKTS
ncbi:ATP-binding protein [Alteromonas stellipolaris]|jgi:signal transduction histidine kinase|uniref:sensor histidine kinase n=1 Tax=Alteromonas stellipolaris TaxID=233316 RepID=UPI002118AF5A|nr:ATP-binding protein [Alteromonas stellipolaris]MCQ8847903.1 ATP-binding protein [Alteromonas stellipolaris]